MIEGSVPPHCRAPRARGLRTLAAAVALALLSACTGFEAEADVADVASAARAFIAAWSERDGEAMFSRLDDASARRWSPPKLERFLERALRSGRITKFEVVPVGEIRPPDPQVVLDSPGFRLPVGYSITYASEVVDDEVVLEGEFEFVYDTEEDRWGALFRRALMWPGIPQAARFEIRARWPRRGRILDRDGRVLARGTASRRTYPFGSLAGTTVGHLEPLSRRDLRATAPGHEPGDLVGGSGLEEAYEERLAGRPRIELAVVDRRGKRLAILEEVPGERGRDVRTTLDVRVQQATARAFGSTVGGAVVLDPSSGDLLAVVTSYEIDPNGYVGVEGVEPFNRALSGLYPAGSAMKVVTAAAALDTGTVTPQTGLTGPPEYRGVRNFESGSFGTIDFATALRYSVNTAFAQVALRLGPRRLYRYANRFGFNRPPAMPLGAATPSFPFPRDEGDLMWSAIGQAQMLATPLEMATVAATVANGGVRMEPRSALSDPRRGERAIKRRTARTLAGLMEAVVQSGTGVAARLAGVRVAGKTGTAEVDVAGERRNHAWFICFAPVEDPEVAVAVVSEYGGVGGEVAAPIARSILAGVLPLTG